MSHSFSAVTEDQLQKLRFGDLARQGEWTLEDYLRLTDCSRRLIELTDGVIELPPLATDRHQSLLIALYECLRDYTTGRGGKVLVGPLRLRISGTKFREPDLLFVRDASDPRRQNRFWLGADLVAEVVSPDDPERDLIHKPRDYAEAGILEYWILNPLDESILVLVLKEGDYVEHGRLGRGRRATSVLLDFGVDVGELFDAE